MKLDVKLGGDKQSIDININIKDFLSQIPSREIIEYAERSLDMIHIDDVDDHCDCEETKLYDFDDTLLIDEIQDRGYTVYEIPICNQSIVRELAMNKIMNALAAMSDSELNTIANKLD